jgi:hypothetical protein
MGLSVAGGVYEIHLFTYYYNIKRIVRMVPYIAGCSRDALAYTFPWCIKFFTKNSNTNNMRHSIITCTAVGLTLVPLQFCDYCMVTTLCICDVYFFLQVPFVVLVHVSGF